MQCPACERPLQPMTVGGVTVDVCAGGCGGIWFDSFEIKKFDEAQEAAGEALLDVERDGSVVVDHTRQHRCPKCPDQVMMRHFFSTKHEVEVDECPACGGFWLDAGELQVIRTQFGSEEERRTAAKQFIHEEFGDELAALEEESRAKTRRLFRFLWRAA